MKELKNLDWLEVKNSLKNLATSEKSKLALESLQPLPSSQHASQTCSEIIDAKQVLDQGIRPHAESLDLFAPWFGRIRKKATLKPIELRDVRHFCHEIIALKEATKAYLHEGWTKHVHQSLMNAEEPLSAIDAIITHQGDIRMDASETLYNLHREKESLQRQIQTQLDRAVKDTDTEAYLQDKYVTTREGRWVLPIRSGSQHFVKGIIHATSQTKQTVFIEPESVVPINNRIRQIEIEIEDEIERLLAQLSEYLVSKTESFESAEFILAQADLRFAQAQFTQKMGGHPAAFCEDEISLVDVRHPLLALHAQNSPQNNVVANSVQLTKDKSLLLLSGPNAGGKTVLLKSIGLAAHMARVGLPICSAEGSRLPFFKDIHVSIGDAQSVDQHLSTFAAHLSILNNATLAFGTKHLLLIDEICGSTDPEEGSALARAFIEKYATNGVFGVLTSHLSPLKAGWDSATAVINGSLEYDRQTGKPTYQFLAGIPGESLAIQTAKRVGVNPEIVDRAIEHLSPTSRARQNALAEIDSMKEEIQTLRQKLENETRSAQSTKRKYQEALDKLRQEQTDLIEVEVKKAQKKIEELMAQTKVIEIFKRHAALQEIQTELPQIIKHSSSPQSGATSPAPTKIQSAEEFAKRFPPGSKIFIPSLGRDGLVQGTPNGKGELPILSESIRLTLHWQEIKPPQTHNNPTNRLVRQAMGPSFSPLQNERTIDLRGKFTEEALEILELALDQATQHQESRIKIIHGHGTETLKKAVRTYLSRSLYVSKWKSGTTETGGDGVTWVELGGM